MDSDPPRFAVWVVFANVRGNEEPVAVYPFPMKHHAEELARISAGGWVQLKKTFENVTEPIIA